MQRWIAICHTSAKRYWIPCVKSTVRTGDCWSLRQKPWALRWSRKERLGERTFLPAVQAIVATITNSQQHSAPRVVSWSSPLCPLLGVRCSNIRVFEYHEYTVGGEVCDPTHSDGGSLVTMSVLLNDKVCNNLAVTVAAAAATATSAASGTVTDLGAVYLTIIIGGART